MNRRDLISITPGALLGSAQPPSTDSLRVYSVKSYGAMGDGSALETESINRTIDACHAAGGGVAYLPPGTFLTGTVILRSNVTLYLEAGATLLGSKNITDYAKHAGPPEKGDANQKHLIFARDAENVGLAGPGRIDGQGPAFWVPSGRVVPPPEESWRDVATYDWKPLDRASPMVEFAGCRNVRIEDVRMENASGWTLRPINCDNVIIRGIIIKNPVIGPNTDGIDPTGCRNVFISDCHIDTGDDAICLKSENPYGGPVRVTKNVTITNCVLTCCCNGLKFGTASRGGFENVTFTNSVIFNEPVDPKARVISGIALEVVDGGWMEGVVISNVRMQNVRTPVFIRRGNRRPRPDGTPGTLRGVMIENVHATGSILTSSITGLPGFDVEDVTLRGIRIDSDEGGKLEWVDLTVPEKADSYPEARMFGRLPAYGIYCRHVKGLRMRSVEFKAAAAEIRPAMLCDDVKDLDVDGLRVSEILSGQPAVRLTQCRSVYFRGCPKPKGMKEYLDVRGERSEVEI
jgi:polygalacturonase